QIDHGATVDFVTATQFAGSVFSFVDGNTSGPALAIEHVTNMNAVVADIGVAGLAGTWPLHVVAQCADAHGFSLRLTGFDQAPSYLLRTSDGSLVTGVESDPATGSLIVHVAGNSILDVQVISEPWTAKLTTSPDPVAIGANVAVAYDANAGTSVFTFLVISFSELLMPIKGGYHITASLIPPSMLLAIPLDAAGDFALLGPVPDVPALSGMRLVMQGASVSPSGHVDAVSNLWGMHVQ
ncbi:MAG TPA: hypothetical protein VK824_07085, partial [Planctomycetota bacterium]|nr:hypothetical protein [Planctomycetota bacterium]